MYQSVREIEIVRLHPSIRALRYKATYAHAEFLFRILALRPSIPRVPGSFQERDESEKVVGYYPEPHSIMSPWLTGLIAIGITPEDQSRGVLGPAHNWNQSKTDTVEPRERHFMVLPSMQFIYSRLKAYASETSLLFFTLPRFSPLPANASLSSRCQILSLN